jgi:membrane protease YdiL (CAAX protease family)
VNESPAQLRLAALLGLASVIATALLFPYALALQPDALALAQAATGWPAWAIVAVQAAQGGVLCLLLAWAGLNLGAPLGLGAPWLAAWLYNRPRPPAAAWWQAAALGVASALLVLGAIALFGPPLPSTAPTPAVSVAFALKGLLASPYGAIVEEIMLRVFVMGVVAWLLSRLSRGQPRAWVMLVALVVAALVFGAGHLPAAAQLAPLTGELVLRVIAYNTLAGLVFGWLYWKRGLEHAMLAHLCADLVLHVAAPLAGGA